MFLDWEDYWGICGIRIMRIRGGGIMGTWDRLGGVSWGRDDVGLISCAGGGTKGWGVGWTMVDSRSRKG